MSSFSKNILPRREHRERAQPALRIQKHGLLEKKKDYKLRAKDHNRKRLRVKILQEKAAFRNPDEFYYGMINSSTNEGRVNRVLNAKEKDAIPIANRDREQRLLAETQDSRYVQLKSSMERAALRRMRDRLHFTASAGTVPKNHVKFVEDENGDEQVINVAHQRRSQDQHNSSAVNKVVAKEQGKAYRLLKRRSQRQEKLDTVLGDMQTAKNLLSKGRRFVVRRADPKTGAPAVYRWRRERRR
ncbi:Utp11 protein [Gracilaria domingensis]|nr:Utp11 protein [Gracilaria domingensis]